MKVIRNLIIAAIIIAAVFIGIAFASGASFVSIFDAFNEDDTYHLQDPIVYEETITSLNIDVEDRSIVIEPTSQTTTTIEHYRKDDEVWQIDLMDEALYISQQDDNDFFDWFNWGFTNHDKKQITILIPETYIFDVDIQSYTGDIDITDFDKLKDVALETTTGDISLNDFETSKLNIQSTTGDISVEEVMITNDLEAEVTTGNIHIKEADASSFALQATTGDIDIEQVITNTVLIETSTGDIQIDNVVADTFDLSATTGQIKMINVDLEDRSLYLDTSTGNIVVDGNKQGNEYTYVDDENYYIDAHTSTGDIKINP